MKQKRLIPLFLALSLLAGCGAAGSSSQETPPASETAAATTEPTAVPVAEQLLADVRGYRASAEPAADAQAVYAALETAWAGENGTDDGTYSGPELCSGSGENGDSFLLRDGILYAVRGKRVSLVSAADGDLTWLADIAVGFNWYETGGENAWGGREKSPVELYVSGERLAVVSDWVEYSNWQDENGVWHFEDLSRTCVDLYDVSDPANPAPVASFGQDGYQCGGAVWGDALCVVSCEDVRQEDTDRAEAASFLPALYSGEEKTSLNAADILLVGDCQQARYTLLGVYDLRTGSCVGGRALLGSGGMICFGEKSVCVLGTRRLSAASGTRTESVYSVTDCLDTVFTDVFRFAVSDRGAELAATTVEGVPCGSGAVRADGEALYLITTAETSRYALYTDASHGFENREAGESAVWGCLYALDGKLNRRGGAAAELADTRLADAGFAGGSGWLTTEGGTQSLYLADFSGAGAPVLRGGASSAETPLWLGAWDDEYAVALRSPAGNGTADLAMLHLSNLTYADSLALGADFSGAPTEPVFLSADSGILALPAEDGYAFYVWSEDGGFTHVQDAYSDDYEGGMRLLSADGWLYAADRWKVSAYRLEDLTFVSDWYF